MLRLCDYTLSIFTTHICTCIRVPAAWADQNSIFPLPESHFLLSIFTGNDSKIFQCIKLEWRIGSKNNGKSLSKYSKKIGNSCAIIAIFHDFSRPGKSNLKVKDFFTFSMTAGTLMYVVLLTILFPGEIKAI